MDVHQRWYKTRTPTSMDEWRWMAKNVWGTNYDFSTPLEMKKKRKKRAKFRAFQASLSGYQLRGTRKDDDSRNASTKTKTRIKAKRQKGSSHNFIKSPKTISIFVSTPLSSILNISISPKADVLELKKHIAERLGIAREKQELYAGPLKMSSVLTLADYGVKDQSNVQLKLCAGLLGGADRPADSSTGNQSQAENVESQGATGSTSNIIQRPVNIQGDYNILLMSSPNSTVNVTRPNAEIYEMKIRLDQMEESKLEDQQRMKVMEEKIETLTADLSKLIQHNKLQATQHNKLFQMVKKYCSQLVELFLKSEIGRPDRVGHGSVYLFVRFASQQELENLWEMYESGELKDEITRILNIDGSHGESLQLDVYIEEEEYRKGIEVFKQHAAANIPAQRMLPMEEWTIDMLKEVLLKERISEHIANQFYEEEIDGSVFSLYSEDDMESDFKLKKGPFRKLLHIRKKYSSTKPTESISAPSGSIKMSQIVPLPKVQKPSQEMPMARTIGIPETSLQPHQQEKPGDGQIKTPVLEPSEEFTQVLKQQQTGEQKGGEASKSRKPDTQVDVEKKQTQSQLESSGARPKIQVKMPTKPNESGIKKPSGQAKLHRSGIDVERQVRELLLGDAKLSLDESYQPILVVNKPTNTVLKNSQNMVDNLSFVTDVNWKVVFDFYELSNQDGLCHYFSDSRKPSLQLPETAESKSVSDLEQVDDPVWIFCNGREDDSNIVQPVLNRSNWNDQRSKEIERVISSIAKQSVIPSSRSVIVFLVLSESNIDILSDTFKKFRSEFRGMDNITFIVEDDAVYKKLEDEAKKWCDDVHELKKRSIVGVPLSNINRIMHRLSRVNITSDKTLPSMGQRSVYIDERDLKKWKDISVVCQNECENTDMDEAHPKFSTFIKEKELQFYRGHQPDWWNFELTDGPFNDGIGYNHVLRRTRFDKLSSKIKSALKGGLSSDLIITITIFHQSGCGASTLCRHQLWQFHKEYRCMVVDRVTSNTAQQILDVRKYKCKKQSDRSPALVLVDDLEDSELTKLIFDLENLSKEMIVKGVLCVLLHSRRTPDPETLLKRSNQRFGYILQQELDSHERDWFQKKYTELERKDLEDELKTGDYKPERLIAFMVKKEECNPKYVQQIVAETLSDVSKKSTKEYNLLKYCALLNSFLGDAAIIPISSCDEFMATSSSIKSRVPWEKTLSPASQMLLIRDQVTSIGVQGIKIVSRCVAEDILRQITEEKDLTLADIVLELLHSDLFQSVSYSKNHLTRNMYDLLIRRKKYDLGDTEETFFSPLIERIYDEDKAKALEILESACDILSHPQYAQQAARLCYILEKDYSLAHKYARKAITMLPNHPYLLDTEAQIYRSEIKEEYTKKYQNENKILPMNESQKLIQLAMSAIDTFKKARQAQTRFSAYFSEVDIAFTLIQIIDHCTPTFRQPGGKEKLKDYLLTESIPDGLQEWEYFHQFFKNLKSSIDDSMQEMDNFLTFCKDASSQNVMAHELDLKKRHQMRFHHLYIDYFGEKLNTLPPRNADSADWRRRQVSAIGADNYHRIFELAKSRDNPENSVKLKKVIDLLSQNKPYNYIDLRNMICAILAISSLGPKESEQVPHVDQVYEMVVELKERAIHLENEIYSSFFLLMFLWPHPDDKAHRIKPPQTLKGQQNDLETRWKTKWAYNERGTEEEKSLHGKVWRRFGRRKPGTFFFLGHGKGLSRFVHINELNATPTIIQRDQFWEKPSIQDRLTPLQGAMYNNTQLSYRTPTKEQLYIRLALPKAEVESQDLVTFYLGFSWGGPYAYNVKPAGRQSSNYKAKTYETAYPRYLNPNWLSVEELETRLALTETKLAELQRDLQKLEKMEQKKKKGGVLTAEQVKKLRRKHDFMKEMGELQESNKKDRETLSHVPEDDIFEIM